MRQTMPKKLDNITIRDNAHDIFVLTTFCADVILEINKSPCIHHDKEENP